MDPDVRAEMIVCQMGKTIEDALPDLIDHIGDSDVGAFLAEVGAALVPGPRGIEGPVVGEDFEGNHFQLMEDAHEDMEDVVVALTIQRQIDILVHNLSNKDKGRRNRLCCQHAVQSVYHVLFRNST